MSEFQLEKIDNKASILPLHTLLTDCGKTMHETFNLMHWYPFMDLEKFETLMRDKNLYGVYQNTFAIATFNLSSNPRDYYFDKLWSNPGEKAFYLGQLGIQPLLQGQGIGKWCMHQIEGLASEAGCKAIRFDGLTQHPWLKEFYEKLGYRFCGTVKPAQWELSCFEKVLG